VAGQKLEARFTAATVEVFHAGKRVASHARNHHAYRHTTVSAYMLNSHQAHLEWTPSRLIHWAQGIGFTTADVVPPSLPAVLGYRGVFGGAFANGQHVLVSIHAHGTDPASLPARCP
jgi:hypothetical protein